MKVHPIILILAGAFLFHELEKRRKLEEFAKRTLPFVIEGMERRGIESPECLKQCAEQYEAENIQLGFYDSFGQVMAQMRAAEQQQAARGNHFCEER